MELFSKFTHAACEMSESGTLEFYKRTVAAPINHDAAATEAHEPLRLLAKYATDVALFETVPAISKSSAGDRISL